MDMLFASGLTALHTLGNGRSAKRKDKAHSNSLMGQCTRVNSTMISQTEKAAKCSLMEVYTKADSRLACSMAKATLSNQLMEANTTESGGKTG